MILTIIYLMVGVIICGFGSAVFESEDYPSVVKVCSYLIIITAWPILILLGFGRALYNAAKKDD